MGVSRIGNDKFTKGVDKNGKTSWRSKFRTRKAGKAIAEAIMEPVRALADETSLLSHYANDLTMRLSLKIDDILDEAKTELKEGLESLGEIKWGDPTTEDVRSASDEVEEKILAELEKFASKV